MRVKNRFRGRVSARAAKEYRTANDEQTAMQIVIAAIELQDCLVTAEGTGTTQPTLGAYAAYAAAVLALAAAPAASRDEAEIKCAYLQAADEAFAALPDCPVGPAAIRRAALRYERDRWGLQDPLPTSANAARPWRGQLPAAKEQMVGSSGQSQPVSGALIAIVADFARPSVMALARTVETLFHDAEVLRWCGDTVAAEGARRQLRRAIVHLAGEPAENRRHLARKERALAVEHLASANMTRLGVELVAAALAAERARFAAPAGGEPLCAEDVTMYKEYLAASSFGEVVSQQVGLAHDHAYCVRVGRSETARRLAVMRRLDVARLAARETTDLREACFKIHVISRAEYHSQDLTAVLAEAEAIERTKWSELDSVRFRIEQPPTVFPGEGERCAQYDARSDPADLSSCFEAIEAHWPSLEAANCVNGVRAGCLFMITDLAVTLAALPARSKPEAVRKLELLSEVKDLIAPEQPTASSMLSVALRLECDRWDILLVDRSERVIGPRH